MREKLLKFVCFAVATVPWAIFVACCVHFGVFKVLRAVFAAFLVLAFAIVAILVIRGCGLELYERIFERGDAE